MGPKLTLGTVGDDVALLHAGLAAIGIDIGDDERQAQAFGPTTRAAVIRLQTISGLHATGEVDQPTLSLVRAALARLPAGTDAPHDEGRPFVAGSVTDSDGLPIEGAMIVASERALRGARELGRTHSDARGRYKIYYSRNVVAPNLQLTVWDQNGAVTFTSDMHYRAPAELEVPLALGGAAHAGPAEFVTLGRTLAPHLGPVRPEDLVESSKSQDIAFLAGATGIDKTSIALYSVAARAARTTQLPTELLYGLLGVGLVGDAQVVALASTADGVDLEKNAGRILEAIYATSPEVRTAGIQSAIDRNLIPAGYAKRAADDLAKLEALASQAALSSTVGFGKTSIGSMLQTARLATTKQQKFIALYATARGSQRAFWSKLRANTEFTKAEVSALRFTLRVGRYTRGHLPLVSKLVALRAEGKIKGLRDLARLTATDWKRIVSEDGAGEPIGVPPSFSAVGPEVAVDSFALLVERNLMRAFPTAAFAARLAADEQASPLVAKHAVVPFLDGNPAFSLRNTNIDRFLHDNPASVGQADPVELRHSLAVAQRLLKVGGTYPAVKALLGDGIHTAQQIYGLGRDRFVAKYGANPAIGAVEAARIYAMSDQTYAMALSLAMRVNQQFIGVDPKAIPALTAPGPAAPAPAPAPAAPAAPAPAIHDLPNLQTLFGSLDACACQECRSVLGAAAYLVDLLRFLSKRTTAGKSAQAVLLERRPDLTQIELSCANTNTILPYIDLVNELLEDAVAPPGDPVAAARSRQTTLSTAELNANPEHVNEDAYATLVSAVFPWTLPFDLPLAEARTYLRQLGAERATLMRAFLPLPAEGSPESIALAVEGLGLSAAEADIITGNTTTDPWQYWGLQEDGNTVFDPVDHGIVHTGTWIDILGHARILLDRARLDYRTLARLLATKFVNPDGSVEVNPESDGSCDLATMTIAGLSEGVLDRLHRFVRLMRRTGWDAYDLDVAVAGLQASTLPVAARLNTTLLRQLDAVRRAMKRFQFSVPVATSLLAGISTHDYVALPGEDGPRYSLYHDLFQNLAVQSPVDPIFVLDGSETEIAGIAGGPLLADHRATLSGALELGDADLSVAIDEFTDGALTLANLSKLQARVALAKGLRLSVRELASLLASVEAPTEAAPFFEAIDPFDGSRPELLERFCAAVDQLRATNLSVPQIDYLLRHVLDPTSGVAPDDVAVGTLLKAIRDGLVKIAAEHAFNPDPTGLETRRRLATLLPRAEVEAIASLLAGTSESNNAGQLALIAGQLGPYLDVAAAQAALVGAGALDAGAARFEYLLTQLLAYSRATLGTSFTVQQLSDALALPVATVSNLVSLWFKSPLDVGKPLIDAFLSLPDIARGQDVAANPIVRSEPGFGPLFHSFAALDKAAQLLNAFDLSTEEAEWLRAHGVAEGWLDPAMLPLAPASTAGGRFARLRRLADASALKTKLPADGTSFTALLELARTGASKSTFFGALMLRTHWSEESLTSLAGDPGNAADRGLLNLAYPDDYRNERALTALFPPFSLLRSFGIGADVGGWLGPTVTAVQADAVKQSVKAKYTPDRWLTIAKPLRDQLREAQRDALVAWLLAHPPAGVTHWHEPNDIYSYYLIDVEMCACQGTSRIVQANAAIQLFVQRCILNLEPDVSVDSKADVDWLQWQWMSRFRVWQANRQIFLYPENWIEPSLRTDKSPFFKELEANLLQGDMTKEAAESGFHEYLTKLDGVSRLEVVGFFHEYKSGEQSVLHVVGRKQGHPPTHYYRTWIDGSRWTAWLKIDLDLASDHVLPVVWNDRLYLFWTVVTRKPDTTQTQPNVALSMSEGKISGSAPPDPSVHLELQLAWSELRAGKWQPTQTAPQVLVVPKPSASTFVTLKSSLEDPLLRIDVFEGDAVDRRHVAEFVLGGVGNGVEAFTGYAPAALQKVGLETSLLGELPLYRGQLALPAATYYDAMLMRPRTVTKASAVRPRIAPLYATYDLYGTLSSEVLLNKADYYRLLTAHQDLRFDSSLPFFYADAHRSYFVIPSGAFFKNGNYFSTTPPPYVYHPYYKVDYTFAPFYHAFVPLLIRSLNVGGLDALFARDLQLNPAAVQHTSAFDFRKYYEPVNVTKPYPGEGIDFDYNAGYALYNWEVFFHAPFQIADSLSLNQKFQDAKRWYEYIFNPTSTTNAPSPQRYWVTKPFFLTTSAEYQSQLISRLLDSVNHHDAAAEHQVAEWRAHPFDPHVIAGLRPVAYQRAIVMKYIDNLIAWGDNLFRQDTLESVNEATQLYVLASEILGPRPEIIPSKDEEAPPTYADIESSLDVFSNAIQAAENLLAPVVLNVGVDPSTPKLPLMPPLAFCVPPNPKLLAYWDTVEDRLFKIRHCLNIEGVFRQLALFAPAIDPGMLVRATAAGLDLGSILADSAAAAPPYRFRLVVRHALDLCQQVRALGADLLGALLQRDAERLALFRSDAEKRLQSGIRDVHAKSLEEAKQQIELVAKSRAVVAVRQQHFANRKDDVMSGWEEAAMSLVAGSVVASAVAVGLESAAGTAHALPTAQFGGSGVGGSPHVTAKLGGANVGNAASSWATVARITAAVLQTGAQLSATMGQYKRRQEDDQFGHDTATAELAQLDVNAEIAKIREQIAQSQLDNHDQVIRVASEMHGFLQEKFTNKELFDWMVAKISGVYFQAYRLAYTAAQRAERCFRRELGLQDSSFIQFGYWDSLKKGLLAADNLAHDLHRLESAYFAQNARTLEVTRHVSLLAFDPLALVALRNAGECTITLPELFFDLETPGHYMRRLKTVAISIACVTGPMTGVSATLTLLDSHVRTTTDLSPQYARSAGTDPRFVDFAGGTSSIVTSHGQRDAGLFAPNIDDERYLPFEDEGAISSWNIRLNAVFPQFDPKTISDVVLHVSYTARDGGAVLRDAASATVKQQINASALAQSRHGLYFLVSGREQYPTEWRLFLSPGVGQDQVLSFDLPPSRFPFFTNGMDIKVTGIDVLARLADPGDYTLVLTNPGGAPRTVTMSADPALGGLHVFSAQPLTTASDLGRAGGPGPAPRFSAKLRRTGAADFRSLSENEIDDLAFVLHYTVTP